MSKQKQLDRIKAKCQMLLDLARNTKTAEAGWHSTIAAIETNIGGAVWIVPCEAFPKGQADSPQARTLGAIIAAWPEELL